MKEAEKQVLNDMQKAQVESIVSSVINLTNSIKGTVLSKFDENIRHRVRELVYEAVDEVHDDDSDWANVNHNMHYDVYLEMREEEGTASDYDLHRPGLIPSQFSTDAKYNEHIKRIAEYRNTHGGKPKLCTSCGQTKSATKFKRGGGSVCNACRCRNYRENKKKEMRELREQQGE